MITLVSGCIFYSKTSCVEGPGAASVAQEQPIMARQATSYLYAMIRDQLQQAFKLGINKAVTAVEGKQKVRRICNRSMYDVSGCLTAVSLIHRCCILARATLGTLTAYYSWYLNSALCKLVNQEIINMFQPHGNIVYSFRGCTYMVPSISKCKWFSQLVEARLMSFTSNILLGVIRSW